MVPLLLDGVCANCRNRCGCIRARPKTTASLSRFVCCSSCGRERPKSSLFCRTTFCRTAAACVLATVCPFRPTCGGAARNSGANHSRSVCALVCSIVGGSLTSCVLGVWCWWQFDPQRWLEGTRPSSFMFPTFSAGPRGPHLIDRSAYPHSWLTCITRCCSVFGTAAGAH